MRPVVAVLALALVVGAVPSAQARTEAPARQAPSSHGSAGAGDPYFPRYGNGGYDVRHYRITAAYDSESTRLTGRTTLRAVATKRLTRFNLDLLLHVSSVRVGGRPARFVQRGGELVVTPRRAVRKGARFRVTVAYAGRPAARKHAGVKPFLTTRSGAVVLGEPEAAAWWFPSNDHPSDKATYDIRLRGPRGRQAISVGHLVGRSRVGDRTQWRWVMRRPMATYLAFAAWGDFRIERRRVGGVRYLYAYDRALRGGDRTRAVRSLRRTPRVVRFLSRYLGRYPYADLGGVVTTAELGFALETQARPVYDGSFFWRGSGLEPKGRNTSVVAHEVAHQWFGDSVSLRRWRDIWLNEGLATYLEWMWGASQGSESVDDIVADWYRIESGRFWRLPIADPGRKHLFDTPVYVRGAMTVHALRREIGDRAFFGVLRRWVRDRRDGHGTTAAFERLAERVSGRDLDGLFDTWLRQRSRPKL